MKTSSLLHFTMAGLVAMTVYIGAPGCIEFDYADDTYTCVPGEPNACPDGFTCGESPTSPGQNRCLSTSNTCGNGVCDEDETPTSCPADCGFCGDGSCSPAETQDDCPTDCGYCGDGECDAVHEDEQSCPSDCTSSCGLSMTGTDHGFIIAEIWVPSVAGDAETLGVDLDGDQLINNKLGELTISMAALLGITSNVGPGIADGRFTTAGRVRVDSFPTDDILLVQLFPATVDGGAPALDGSDNLSSDGGAPASQFLCGSMAAGLMEAGPGDLQVELPMFVYDADPILVTLSQARMTGQVTAAGWELMHVGGGLTEEEIQDHLIPGMADSLNARIEDDCSGNCNLWTPTILALLDDQCDPAIPGCESVDTDPDCAVSDPITEPTPWITATEIRCNNIVHSALTPDIDSNNDGTPDLLSVGWMVQAVPATIE